MPRDEQASGGEGHEETRAISFLTVYQPVELSWNEGKASCSGHRTAVFPSTPQQVVSREGFILYSLSSLGVVQE